MWNNDKDHYCFYNRRKEQKKERGDKDIQIETENMKLYARK
jgi:hypothetical protein